MPPEAAPADAPRLDSLPVRKLQGELARAFETALPAGPPGRASVPAQPAQAAQPAGAGPAVPPLPATVPAGWATNLSGLALRTALGYLLPRIRAEVLGPLEAALGEIRSRHPDLAPQLDRVDAAARSLLDMLGGSPGGSFSITRADRSAPPDQADQAATVRDRQEIGRGDVGSLRDALGDFPSPGAPPGQADQAAPAPAEGPAGASSSPAPDE